MNFPDAGRSGATARPHRNQAWLAAAWLALACGSLGCTAKNPYPVGSYERGVFFADQGKDLAAVGAFETYVRQNPTEDLAAEAQYRKAMTYMEMEEYPLAAVEFQIMRKDYPTSPLVEDALFEEGKAYLLQVGRVERDVTGALEARLHFLKFSQEYPNSAHITEVVEYMREISDLMVRKRLEQIKVYDQLKRYPAIAIVLDETMRDEAGSTLMPQVMWERGQVAERLDDPDTAARMYEDLVNRYPTSDFRDRAAAALRRLDGEEDPVDDQDHT